MRIQLICVFCFILFSLPHCGGKIVMDNDPEITIGLESVYFYRGERFTGIMKAIHPNGIIRLTNFKDGLEDGRAFDTFPNGLLAAEYFYNKGKFVGVHRAWYESGKARFRYEYNEQGLAHGEHWEWHEEGNVFRYSRYENGVSIGTKVWRKDGKIYSNYAFTPERLYGVIGSKLCFKLKGDESNQKTVINP